MKNTLIPLLSATMLLASGCATGPTPIPDAASAGAQLYRSKCSACHALPHPKRNSYPEWQHLLVLMQQRMQERGIPTLTTSEQKTLLAYLQQHAR